MKQSLYAQQSIVQREQEMMGDHKHLLKTFLPVRGEPAGPWSKVPKEIQRNYPPKSFISSLD